MNNLFATYSEISIFQIPYQIPTPHNSKLSKCLLVQICKAENLTIYNILVICTTELVMG